MKPFPASLDLPRGRLDFPVFLPDATQAVVRGVDAADLEDCRIQAVVMNTFHLMQRPGSSTIQALGGLHKMSAWQGPIITDSGGFQAYSLIHQNSKFGRLGANGITFQPENNSRKFQLTPEKSVQLQLSYGADVVICLDDCTHVDAPRAEQEDSVERTIAWARCGRLEFDRTLDSRKIPPAQRPLLFAVIQGGGHPDLRKKCAEALLELNFDGFGYGGWPLDKEGALLEEMIALVRELIPPSFPLHALGVGHPRNLLACHEMGYQLFDSAMPTRDARHARLYVFTTPSAGARAGLEKTDGSWMEYLYINDDRFIKGDRPVSDLCDCLTCRRYSRGYLHHLFKIDDSLFLRLATLHNLRFMTQLSERIRGLPA